MPNEINDQRRFSPPNLQKPSYTTETTVGETTKSRVSLRYALLAVFLGLGLLAKFFILPFALFPEDVPGFTSNLIAGVALGEVCLVGVWAALGEQAPVFRLPISLTLAVFIVCSTAWGISYSDVQRPQDSDYLILALLGAMFYGVQLPLWIYRAWTKNRIVLPDTREVLESNQFSLRHLLVLTAMVAILLALLRTTYGKGESSFDLTEMLFIVLLFALLSGITCLPCVLLAFAESARSAIRVLLALLLTFIGGPLLVAIISQLPWHDATIEPDILIPIYTLCAGFNLSMLIVLLTSRAVGYRLQPSLRAHRKAAPNSETRDRQEA